MNHISSELSVYCHVSTHRAYNASHIVRNALRASLIVHVVRSNNWMLETRGLLAFLAFPAFLAVAGEPMEGGTILVVFEASGRQFADTIKQSSKPSIYEAITQPIHQSLYKM